MSSKIDEGPIICKNIVNIKNCNSYQSIRRTVYLNSIDTIKEAIKFISLNKIDKRISSEEGKYYKPIKKLEMDIILKNYGDEINNA